MGEEGSRANRLLNAKSAVRSAACAVSSACGLRERPIRTASSTVIGADCAPTMAQLARSTITARFLKANLAFNFGTLKLQEPYPPTLLNVIARDQVFYEYFLIWHMLEQE